MRTPVVLVVALFIGHSPLPAVAQTPGPADQVASRERMSPRAPTRTIQDAIARAARQFSLASSPSRDTDLPARQQEAQNRSWIRRHPALFGALAGAAAGAASSSGRWNELYCATGSDEDCLFHGGAGVLFGAGAGAGIGALVGWLAGRSGG